MTQITALAAHPRNYNRHSAGQVADLARSLTRFGQRKPVVTWHGVILAGHGLVEAARSLGWTEIWTAEAPEEWTEAEALAFVAADNELARAADPDVDALAALVSEVGDVDAELARLAAGGEEALKRLLATLAEPAGDDPGAQVDKAEELRVKWGVEPGQLWALGEHRLICGDCTDGAVVARVMGGEKADMVLTSPPYNRGTTTGGGFNSGGLSQQLTNAYASYADDLPVEEYRQWQSELLVSWWNMLSDDGAIYYNHRPRVQAGLFETPLDWNPGLPVRQIIIWHSGAGINFAPTHYRVSHEWIVLFAKPNFRLSSKGLSGVGDVWQFGAVHIAGHPAPFPVQLAEQAISTTDCVIVFDPFLGSGTTLIACERLGRRCRAVEISPGYVAVALERWSVMTGRTPVLAGGVDG